jgi:hypothetical protein
MSFWLGGGGGRKSKAEGMDRICVCITNSLIVINNPALQIQGLSLRCREHSALHINSKKRRAVLRIVVLPPSPPLHRAPPSPAFPHPIDSTGRSPGIAVPSSRIKLTS